MISEDCDVRDGDRHAIDGVVNIMGEKCDVIDGTVTSHMGTVMS